MRWLIGAGILWFILVGVVVTRVAWSPHRNTVYPILVHGARQWQAGAPLYGKEGRLGTFDYFVYPPPTACLLLPWAELSDRAGGILWRLVGVAAYLAAFGAALRVLRPGLPFDDPRWALLLAVLLPHSIDSLNNGQSNLLIAALLVAGTTACVRGWWNSAAVCLAVPALMKVYPLAIGLLAALVWPRLWPRLALAVAVGLALPFACQAPDYVLEQYRQFAAKVVGEDRTRWTLANAPHDFHLLLRHLGLVLDRGVYAILQFGMAVLAALLCWRMRARSDDAGRLRRVLGLGVGWIIAFGPATESSTFVLLAPVLTWEVDAAWSSGRRGARLAITAVYTLLCLSGMALWFPGGRAVAQVLQPLAGLIHWLIQVRLAWCGDAAGADAAAVAAEPTSAHAATDEHASRTDREGVGVPVRG